MPNDPDLLQFLAHSETRVKNLLVASKKMRNLRNVKFIEAAADLESKFPGSKVHFYGTRIMNLGHEKSHLNIFIDVDNSYWEPQSPEKVEKMKEKLLEYLKTEVEFQDSKWIGRVSTLRTPVPTVRVFLAKSYLQCDMTFSSGLGVEATNLIYHMFSLQPEAFKLYHFVRIWIHIDEFSFKRYMVALLVIFFLQNKKLMPSVVQMQEDVPEKFIEGWNVEFNDKKKIKDFGMEKLDNYEEYLADFFDFYGNFDFNQNVISPYFGRAFSRKTYPENDTELLKFKDNIKTFNKSAVNVADILNLNFNCAYGVGKKRSKKFTIFGKHAAELLRNNLYNE